MNEQLRENIKKLRKKIEDDHALQRNEMEQYYFESILDRFLESPENSELEKAVFLMLNQFPFDQKHYFVNPHEKVLVANIYDDSQMHYEYEIDFAVYSGSKAKPIKVAVECDGLRSHREKHSERDQRKDVNLQAAGWIVVRFGSHQLHEEIEKYFADDLHISKIAKCIETIVERTMDLITRDTYVDNEIRSALTGYKWGAITCSQCNFSQMDRLNHADSRGIITNRRKFRCRHCGQVFTNP